MRATSKLKQLASVFTFFIESKFKGLCNFHGNNYTIFIVLKEVFCPLYPRAEGLGFIAIFINQNFYHSFQEHLSCYVVCF
jgi:hypothetical protein